MVRKERGVRALHQAVRRGVGLVGFGVLAELPHECHHVGGEGAGGLGDEEVDRVTLLEGVVVVAAVCVDTPDARGAVEGSAAAALAQAERFLDEQLPGVAPREVAALSRGGGAPAFLLEPLGLA